MFYSNLKYYLRFKFKIKNLKSSFKRINDMCKSKKFENYKKQMEYIKR